MPSPDRRSVPEHGSGARPAIPAAAVVPARIEPPERPLPLLPLLRTAVRNPIEMWPRAVYEEPRLRWQAAGRTALFAMDPDLVRAVLVDEADAFEKADEMRRALEPALGQGLLTADGAHWRWQRRAAAPILRPERITRFLPEMLAVARLTRERWLVAAGTERDVAHEMMRTTFDIVVATMLSGEDSLDVARIERAITDYLETTGWVVALNILRAPRWAPYPGKRRADRARRYLRAELTRVMAARRAAGHRASDLVGLLGAATDPESGAAMDDRDLVDNLLTFVAAGHETTALALTWTFYLLALHPDVERRVLDEIAAVAGGGEIAAEHVAALAFARQVVQEAMRLYPPAPIVMRSAVREVALPGGPVPAGTTVYVPIYAVHRHRTLWPDPDAFDPDRFAPEAVRARHRFAYLPFGAGPRICIGMSFALAEAVAILAVLLPDIRLSLRPGYVPGLKARVTLRPDGGMPMLIERR